MTYEDLVVRIPAFPQFTDLSQLELLLGAAGGTAKLHWLDRKEVGEPADWMAGVREQITEGLQLRPNPVQRVPTGIGDGWGMRIPASPTSPQPLFVILVAANERVFASITASLSLIGSTEVLNGVLNSFGPPDDKSPLAGGEIRTPYLQFKVPKEAIVKSRYCYSMETPELTGEIVLWYGAGTPPRRAADILGVNESRLEKITSKKSDAGHLELWAAKPADPSADIMDCCGINSSRDGLTVYASCHFSPGKKGRPYWEEFIKGFSFRG